MVVRLCVTVFYLCAIFFAISCASSDEAKPLRVTKVSPQDLQIPAVNQFSEEAEKSATSSCKPPVALQSLISVPPFLPILFAKSASSLLADKQCGRDAQRFLNELDDGTFWAARMFDASTKVPEGVLFGNKAHYGNFDECYTGGTEDFGTRYCLIDIAFNRSHLGTGNFPPYTDVRANNCTWDYFKVKPRIWAVDSSSLRVALCAPSSCTSQDIELCLAKALENNFRESTSSGEFPLSVSVNPHNCQARNERRSFGLGSQLFCVFVIVLCTLIGVASWLHSTRPSEEQEKPSLVIDIVDCFSVQTNAENLFQDNHTSGAVSFPDIWRIQTAVIVTMTHRFIQYTIVPSINSESFPVDSDNWLYIALTNTTISLDPIFAYTAMFATISWLIKLHKGKPLNFWSHMIRRYIRLTTPYALVILISIFVMPYTGSGALWALQAEQEAAACRETWWHNLLYINNYMGSQYCISQSWYLAVDLQAHIILFFVVLCFWKLPRPINILFLTFLAIIFSLVGSYATYVNKYPPTLLSGHIVGSDPTKAMNDVRDLHYVPDFYVKTHFRMAPFMLGALGGALVLKMKQANLRLSQSRGLLQVALSLLGAGILHAVVARYVWGVASDFEIAFYGGFHRALYSTLGIVFIIGLAFTENLSEFLRGLNGPWMHGLSKLTYGMYLTHTLVIIYTHGSVRTPKTITLLNGVSELLLDLFISILISIFLWFVAESPTEQLLKLRRKRAARRLKSD